MQFGLRRRWRDKKNPPGRKKEKEKNTPRNPMKLLLPLVRVCMYLMCVVECAVLSVVCLAAVVVVV